MGEFHSTAGEQTPSPFPLPLSHGLLPHSTDTPIMYVNPPASPMAQGTSPLHWKDGIVDKAAACGAKQPIWAAGSCSRCSISHPTPACAWESSPSTRALLPTYMENSDKAPGSWLSDPPSSNHLEIEPVHRRYLSVCLSHYVFLCCSFR